MRRGKFFYGKSGFLRKSAAVFSLMLVFFPCFSQESDFSKGQNLFSQNRVEEAVPYLKSAVSSGNSPKAYVYLSVAYQKMGLLDEALAICRDGLSASGTDKKVLSYNAGNICFLKGDYVTAERYYGMAILADPFYSAPVLNRANARLKKADIDGCISDYERYLELSPRDEQRQEIESLIALLKEEKVRLAQEEQRRLEEEERIRREEAKIAEERARQQELERIERERKEREEAERRRKLLEDVASSLQNTETENMSAGAEGTFDYGYETELE